MSLSPENKALIERALDAFARAMWNANKHISTRDLNRLLDAARQEGARAGEPTEAMLAAGAAELCRLSDHPDDLDIVRCIYVVMQALYASPAEPSGWPEKVREFIDNWFAPWGSWKTEWWEDVSRDREMTHANALLVLRGLLPPTSEGGGDA